MRQWIEQESIKVLNVAGPRESRSVGIYEAADDFLREVLNEHDSLQ